MPEPAERSTFVLLSSLALLLLFWQWQPMGGLIWDVENPAGRWSVDVQRESGRLIGRLGFRVTP